MSTKTTLKRIALVAVSALGFGVMTAIAPASASAADVTAVSAGAPAPARVGVFSGDNLITLTSGTSVTSAVTVTAQIASAPAASTTAGLKFVTAPAGTTNRISSLTTETTTTTTLGVAAAVFNLTTNAKEVIALDIKPDVAGTYQILVTVDGNTSTGFSAGKKSVAYSLTTAGTPTSMTISRVSGAIVGGAAEDFGLNLAISLKDANGNATTLGANEGLAITQSASSSAVTLNDAATASFDSSSPITSTGAYLLRAEGKTIGTAATNIITVTGDGVLPRTFVQNYSATMTAATAVTGGTLSLVLDADGTAMAAGNGYTGSTATWKTADVSTHYFQYALASGTASAATNYAVNVTGTNGVKYATSVTVAKDKSSGIVAISSAITELDAQALTVAVAAGTNPSHTIAYDEPTPTTMTVVSPNVGIITAPGSSVTFVAKLTDEYGNAMANRSATVTVTGRNTVTSRAIGITDASGLISYTLTDAGTTGTTDSVTFTSTVSSSAYTLTYGTFTVAKVSFTGGSTTAGVANATTTVHPIEADNTPESAVQDAVATVTDANGSLLVGVPVTFTVSGTTGAAITSTTRTAYTGTDGKATAKVYAWIAGTYTVTATAGGVSGTGSYTFANSRPADARVLSASADGGTITAKIVDRFGNPVKGANVYVTKSGSGFFGNGNSKTTDTTGADGTVQFVFNGTGDVTVSTLSYDAALGANAEGQTCALAGNLTCASGATAATAFTATTAGTSLVNEKNVGSSFAPAGVSSVKLAITNGGSASASTAAEAAADAAAEAIDAANAATDAANLAAEAADAATVAAEEARDAADAATAAVEELATQVATLMAALKAQITTLANTVAKIAKKVRA